MSEHGDDNEHAALRRDLGAYLLGSLAPADRAAVDRHLGGCAECRGELASIAPLPGLLGRLTPEEARDGPLTPPADLLRRTVAAVGADRDRQRRTLRRWRFGAAAAAVAAVVGVAAAVVIPDLVTGTAGEQVVAMAGSTGSGSGSLQARAWGTAVELDLAELPAARSYQALATASDGRVDVAASWGATPSGRAVVDGATAIQRADLVSIEVRTADGRSLMTLPC